MFAALHIMARITRTFAAAATGAQGAGGAARQAVCDARDRPECAGAGTSASKRGCCLSAQICEILGPYYVPYVIREARHVLKHGYQLHVLAWTIFDSLPLLQVTTAVISASVLNSTRIKHPEGFNIDDAIADLLAVFMEDIFGAAAEEKEASCCSRVVPH